ncbi:MAG: hypothetical protein J4432_01250 [DPANN group archaeon]|nr:hypothetical protein [DPANN group archaeon]
MARYAFVFGKNWQLSLAELLSYFQHHGIGWGFVDLSKKALMVDLEALRKDMVHELGGTLRIVRIEKEFTADQIPHIDFGGGVDDYLSVHGSYNIVKVARKVFNRIPKDAMLSTADLAKKDIREVNIVYGLKKLYYGPTVQFSDPFYYKELDLKKPVTRPELGISPSRAQILLNLAHSEENVLDPFCGIGTIGIMGFGKVDRIYLSDNDKNIVKDARRNMEWVKKRTNASATAKTKFETKPIDARVLHEAFPENSMQSVATEPDLGPKMRFRPDKSDAQKILSYLHHTYQKFFQNVHKIMKPGALVAIVFPAINSKAGKVFMNKKYEGFRFTDLYDGIPQHYRDELKLHKNFVLDEEREKGKSRVTIREFAVYRVKKH